jgi:uracil-DNA glycosylase
LWLDQLLAKLPLIDLTLLIGQHAQRNFLGRRRQQSLAETTMAWAEYCPEYISLRHPSPRNTPWFQRNSGLNDSSYPNYAAGLPRFFRAEAVCDSSSSGT